MDGSSGSAGTTSTTANEQPGTVGSCDRPWLGSHPDPASNAIARRSTLSVVSVVAGSITSDAVDLEDTAILGRADRVIEIDTIGDPNELDTDGVRRARGPR